MPRKANETDEFYDDILKSLESSGKELDPNYDDDSKDKSELDLNFTDSSDDVQELDVNFSTNKAKENSYAAFDMENGADHHGSDYVGFGDDSDNFKDDEDPNMSDDDWMKKHPDRWSSGNSQEEFDEDNNEIDEKELKSEIDAPDYITGNNPIGEATREGDSSDFDDNYKEGSTITNNFEDESTDVVTDDNKWRNHPDMTGTEAIKEIDNIDLDDNFKDQSEGGISNNFNDESNEPEFHKEQKDMTGEADNTDLESTTNDKLETEDQTNKPMTKNFDGDYTDMEPAKEGEQKCPECGALFSNEEDYTDHQIGHETYIVTEYYEQETFVDINDKFDKGDEQKEGVANINDWGTRKDSQESLYDDNPLHAVAFRCNCGTMVNEANYTKHIEDAHSAPYYSKEAEIKNDDLFPIEGGKELEQDDGMKTSDGTEYAIPDGLENEQDGYEIPSLEDHLEEEDWAEKMFTDKKEDKFDLTEVNIPDTEIIDTPQDDVNEEYNDEPNHDIGSHYVKSKKGSREGSDTPAEESISEDELGSCLSEFDILKKE